MTGAVHERTVHVQTGRLLKRSTPSIPLLQPWTGMRGSFFVLEVQMKNMLRMLKLKEKKIVRFSLSMQDAKIAALTEEVEEPSESQTHSAIVHPNVPLTSYS